MNRIGCGLLALALLLGCVVPAFANDRYRFQKLIKKYAVNIGSGLPVPFEAKVACSCTAALPAKPGFLGWESLSNQLYCMLPVFDPDGDILAAGACQQFEVLAK